MLRSSPTKDMPKNSKKELASGINRETLKNVLMGVIALILIAALYLAVSNRRRLEQGISSTSTKAETTTTTPTATENSNPENKTKIIETLPDTSSEESF